MIHINIHVQCILCKITVEFEYILVQSQIVSDCDRAEHVLASRGLCGVCPPRGFLDFFVDHNSNDIILNY